MSGDEKITPFNFTGEIIEIYEKDKSMLAKIKYDPGFIDICIDNISDAHLNDKIIILSNISINSIVQQIEGNKFKIR